MSKRKGVLNLKIKKSDIFLIVFLLIALIILIILLQLEINKKITFSPVGYPPYAGKISIFGQTDITQTSYGLVTANKAWHPSAISVDSSSETPIIYVAENGNSRVLAFQEIGEKSSTKNANMVFGQPDFKSSACNGDDTLGMYKNPTSTSLCLSNKPVRANTGEEWGRKSIDADSKGNLYVVDSFNNRVLKYNKPFGTDKNNGEGDNAADFVWGQTDLYSNKGNANYLTPSSTNLRVSTTSTTGPVTSGGVFVDDGDSVWVTDTYNSRVLRFNQNEKTANLVLGQLDFNTAALVCNLENVRTGDAPLDKFCRPVYAKINKENGYLYVIDQHSALNYELMRILEFRPPFVNGMSATRYFLVADKLIDNLGAREWMKPDYIFDFTFNTYKVGEYSGGDIWISDGASRATLIDLDKNKDGSAVNPNNKLVNPYIIKVIGSIDKQHGGRTDELYSNCNNQRYDAIYDPWSLDMDKNGNIYLADESLNKISMFTLPYESSLSSTGKTCLPIPNGELYYTGPSLLYSNLASINSVDKIHIRGAVGVFVYGNQLIAKDQNRYLFWNDYTKDENQNGNIEGKIAGRSDSDIFSPGEHNLGGWSYHALDDKNRLWTVGGQPYELSVFQLPLEEFDEPLESTIEIHFKGQQIIIPYLSMANVGFDSRNKRLWVNDRNNHRLLGIKNYDDFEDGILYVDMVLGQVDLEHTMCNQDMEMNGRVPNLLTGTGAKPNSFCVPVQTEFDKFGNMYVVENAYEAQGNMRIVMIEASDLKKAEDERAASTSDVYFPNLYAKKVFSLNSLTINLPIVNLPINGYYYPKQPISVAFNSKNQMILANDGGSDKISDDPKERLVKQLWLYNDPLKKNTDGSYIQGQLPDAYIPLPIGAPGEILFDENDNLIIQDHTWRRILMINFDNEKGDLSWLYPTPAGDIDEDRILDFEDIAICGNSSIDPGEQCDDGNRKSDDGCSSTCKNEDEDEDNVWGVSDNCLFDYNPNQEDADNDKVGTACDDCPLTPPGALVNYQGCSLPTYESFKSGIPVLTTNFSNPKEVPNILNTKVSLAILGNSRVIFDTPINAAGVNFDNLVKLNHQRIFVNVTKAPFLNVSSRLRFFNIKFTTPKLIKDGTPYPEDKYMFEEYKNDVYKVKVNEFSEYSVVEGYVQPPPPSGDNGGDPPISCKVNWTCNSWSSCNNRIKTRVCIDTSKCNNNATRPPVRENCIQCIENWVCMDWEECINNKQVRTCIDDNECGTEINKSETEKDCPGSIISPSTNKDNKWLKELYFYLIIGIICLLIIIFTIIIYRNYKKIKAERKIDYKKEAYIKEGVQGENYYRYMIYRKNYLKKQKEIYDKYLEARKIGNIKAQKEYYKKYYQNKKAFKELQKKYTQKK